MSTLKSRISVTTAFIVVALLAVFSAQVASAAEGGDVIIRIDGTTIPDVTIKSEEFVKVVYWVGNSKTNQEIKSAEVRDITRNSFGRSFLSGEASRRTGAYDEAIKSYKRTLATIADRSLRAKAEPVVQYCIAECYRGWGKFKEAKKEYDEFLKKSAWGKHRYVPAVHHGIARLMLDGKKFDSADKSFRELGGGKYGQHWKAKGELGRGIVQFERGAYKAALGTFKQVERSAKAQNLSMIEQESRMWQGKCLLGGNDFQKAVEFFKKITDATKVDSKEVMAAAYNGLGKAYMGLSRGKDKDLNHKALMAHLRVVLVYAGIRNEYVVALKLAADAASKLGLEKTARELEMELKEAGG